MTWRELFLRAWRVLRVRFARQHMCSECGDACVKRFSRDPRCDGAWWWECEACEELRQLEARARAATHAKMMQNAYGALQQNQAYNAQLAAMQNAYGALQQNQVRLPGPMLGPGGLLGHILGHSGLKFPPN